jgi:hypothetical protein
VNQSNRQDGVMSKRVAPGEVEIYGYFRKHLGPRFMAAGLRIQFHYNQDPGIHFKAPVSERYEEAILEGLKDAMSIRYPDFPKTGSIWITEVTDDVDSSWMALYLAARGVIDLAYASQQSETPLPRTTEN